MKKSFEILPSEGPEQRPVEIENPDMPAGFKFTEGERLEKREGLLKKGLSEKEAEKVINEEEANVRKRQLRDFVEKERRKAA